MSNICAKCKKNFDSRSGLYKHKKQYHPDEFNKEKKTENTTCQFCNKNYSTYISKWKHEKICKLNIDVTMKEMKEIKEEIKDLKKQINNTGPKNYVNKNSNNNITNNNTQNVIYVLPFGNEPNNALPLEYLEKIIDNEGMNSVLEIVKKKHFNPELPQYHNFCVTARNENYACIVDPETKKLKYVNKKDVFDKVYRGVVNNVNSIDKPKKENVKETIDKINNLPVSRKILKKLHCNINEEAYHYRDMVKKTWDKADFESEGKFLYDLNNVSDDSDDSSDEDSKSVDILPKNKNHKMILEIKKLLEDINDKSYLFKQPTKDIEV